MVEDKQPRQSTARKGMISLQPGQPIQFSEVEEVTAPTLLHFRSPTRSAEHCAPMGTLPAISWKESTPTKKILRRRTLERLATSSLSDAVTEYW